MYAIFVVALIAGLALGARMMTNGVLRAGPASTGLDPADATAPGRGALVRARVPARLLTPLGAATLTSFGFAGALVTRLTSWGGVARFGTALAGAAAAALVATLVRHWALDPRAPLDPEDDPRFAVQGVPARVVRSIEGALGGEIAWRRGGRELVMPARTIDDQPLEAGTEVVIDRLDAGVAWVESWSRVEQRL